MQLFWIDDRVKDFKEDDNDDEYTVRSVTVGSEFLESGSVQIGYYSYIFDQMISLSEPYELSQINVDWKNHQIIFIRTKLTNKITYFFFCYLFIFL